MTTHASSRHVLRVAAHEAFAVLFFFAVAAWFTRPLIGHVNSRVLAGGDPLVDLWTIDWLSENFFHPSRIFQGNIFHPARHAVLYSDLSLGTVVLLLPFRAFITDPVPLYNLALLLSLTFAGWSFHALVRHLTRRRSAGFLTGVLATFGSHQMSHIYHLNLLTTGWLAILLLGLHLALSKPSWRVSLLIGVSLALSGQSSGYYGVAAALLAVLFAAVHWRALLDRRTFACLAGAAFFGVLLSTPYLAAYRELGLRRPLGMSIQMSFDPGRDLTSYGYLYRQALGSQGERLFPGLLSLILSAVALVRRRTHVAYYAVATLAMLVVSLGPHAQVGGATVSLPYGWLVAIPPLDGMRHPYTFAAVATFTLSVLAGLGWAGLKLSTRGSIGSAVVVVALAETLGPPPALRDVPRGVPAAYVLLEGLPPGAILELPVFSEEALLWAARHGRPVLNGQGSAFVPVNTLRLERYITNHWLNRVPVDADRSKPMLFLLRHFDLRYLILPTGRSVGWGPLADAFDRSRFFSFVAQAEDGDRIYAVRAETPLPNAGEEWEEPGEVVGQDRQSVGQKQQADPDQ